MLQKMTYIIDNLVVYPERMKQNIEISQGLTFSQRLLLALIDKKMTREEAYQIVQQRAMEGWNSTRHFKELVLEDEEIERYLSREEIESAFDLREHLRHVNHIFGRVFSQKEG